MRFIKGLLLTVLALIVVLAIGGLLLPASAHVERSTTIQASPAAIFPLVNNLKRSNEWSPWAKIDPATKFTFTGPEAGVGAKSAWESEHPNVGNGSQEIVESETNTRVKTHLDFGDQGTAEAFFTLSPKGKATEVTWGFDADFGYNLLGRYFGYFMFDDLIGGDYEKGLANLKTLAESAPAEPVASEPAADDSSAAGEETPDGSDADPNDAGDMDMDSDSDAEPDTDSSDEPAEGDDGN